MTLIEFVLYMVQYLQFVYLAHEDPLQVPHPWAWTMRTSTATTSWGSLRCTKCFSAGYMSKILYSDVFFLHCLGICITWNVLLLLFPTCQVRVVRFYHSCSPPRLAILLLLLLLLLRQHLLHHLCLHFQVHCCLANSSPNFSPTSELSVHRLGPSQLSVHHWTSTWDLPSSVCTAGPQRPDRMPEEMPDRMSDRMPEDMPDKMP